MKTVLRVISVICIYSALIFILGTINWIEDAYNSNDVRWMMYSFLWWLKLHMSYTVPLLLVAWLSNVIIPIIRPVKEVILAVEETV